MIVDYHAHWTPPAYMELCAERDQPPRSERASAGGWHYEFDASPLGGAWDFPRQWFDLAPGIAEMDANGVDVSVLSPAMPGDVTRLDLPDACEILGVLNAELARAQREHPDRIRSLAMLPLQDVDASIEMLDHAISELGLSGVCMTVNVSGHSIATPDLLPLYERIEQLNVPIILHPSTRSTVSEGVQRAGGGRIAEIGLAWVYDTSLTALSLIYNGTLDACPTLSILHPHVGGLIPFLMYRLEHTSGFPPNKRAMTQQRPAEEYLRTNFFVDVAGSDPQMIHMTVAAYGSDRILWGSDYPFDSRARVLERLAGLEPSLAETIRTNQLPGLALPSPRT